jgi:hypothetical protein
MIGSFPSEPFTPILTNEKEFDINTLSSKGKKDEKSPHHRMKIVSISYGFNSPRKYKNHNENNLD